MSNSSFDIFHQARRILCKCPNPECGEISRLSEIDIKSGVITEPTWLDDHEDNVDEYDTAAGEFAGEKAELKAKGTAKGRIEAEKDMKNFIKNSLIPVYQQMPYDPRDISVIGHPVDFVVFNGANKVRMKEADSVKEVLLLSKKTDNPYLQKLHSSIHDVIEKEDYEWQTAKVLDGSIEFESK